MVSAAPKLAAIHSVSRGTYEYGYKYLTPLLGNRATRIGYTTRTADTLATTADPVDRPVNIIPATLMDFAKPYFLK
jgi:hypothetical protein